MPELTPNESTNLPESMNTILAIAVGNTRTRVGVLKGTECAKAQSFSTNQAGEIASFTAALFEEFEFPADEPVILISTVSAPAADAIEESLKAKFGWSAYRLDRDLAIPIKHTLTESGEETVGQDRLLCAIGAFNVVKQACVVVDMGTAITVDFVDGEGIFHGGAILPGVSMMLESLNTSTAHLPAIQYEKLDPSSHEPGKQTDDAMRLGVTAAARGAIRYLVERYAQFYEGYPQVVATGGDMGLLEDDELIESFVPDLQLHGIRVACTTAIQDEEDFDDELSESFQSENDKG